MPLGIDVGGTKIAYGEVENGTIIWKEQISTPASQGEIIQTLKTIILSYKGNRIGIGIPGQVKDGEVLFTPNIPLSGIKLAKLLHQETGKDIFVENDANAFLIAEAQWGVAQGYKNIIGITLGTGIGGAIMINGKIWQGVHGAGAEFGHMAVMEDGPICGCGSRGCVEAIASPRSIEKWAEIEKQYGMPTIMDNISMVEIMELKDNDTLAKIAYDRFIRYIGMAVANLANILDPEAIVFGGSGVLSWDIWQQDAHAVYERRVLPSLKGQIPWLKARFSNNAGIIGAAALAI
ncbi:MAG: ROK family protein [Dictyoglomi bacterium]|nr:ROK family protein [Dictyoglomota bacterium]